MFPQYMKVLVVGRGAREHALYASIKKSKHVTQVICAPGNAGIPFGNRRPVEATNIEGMVKLAQEEKVDFVVIGPEAALAAGLVDRLQAERISVFGPNANAAMLESSKIFAKVRCDRWGIPTARYEIAETFEEARAHIKRTGHLVIKADGLCDGKGVIVAETEKEAIEAAREILVTKRFGSAGNRILIEECLHGEECSVMAICDGKNELLLPTARDYKRALEGDLGKNTGGMGGYSPDPRVDNIMLDEITVHIIRPIVRGMAEEGIPYHGLLYAGIMLAEDGPKLLEINVRFGDPEAQVVLPRINSDIVEYMYASMKLGGLQVLGPLEIDPEVTVCRNLVSGGYPDAYETGFPIRGFGAASHIASIFHARTAQEGDILTCGGRVMSCVGKGKTFAEANEKSLLAAEMICFENKYFRRDIAEGL